MALKTFRPTSPGLRHVIVVQRGELWKGKPVKVLTEAGSSDFQKRFVQEMRTLAALNHPAIVKVLGGGRDDASLQPPMIDILVPEGQSQEEILRDFDSARDRPVELPAVVPAPR